MDDELSARTEKLREAFQLGPDTELLSSDTAAPELPSELFARLARFHIEWHIIPADTVVPFDDQYVARFYRMAPREFAHPRDHAPSYREVLAKGHAKHQGRIVGVETTQKPRYLPGNRQFYGTPYGFDASADPFAYYMGRAGLTNATRYAHNYISLREFVRVVNEDWRARRLLPQGYRLTVCPPAIFNFIGTLFHPEWSETETLELGFYRDEQGNATCYAVGCNAPGDFSYINEVELETDWTLAGFRLALVPE
ncbi:MAG: hypothetical protein DMF64_10810 [Acidobacteria bacterium]|nr:MAG: hypothetical protein DMF64_10810 [Acidobacteriota bacterium]